MTQQLSLAIEQRDSVSPRPIQLRGSQSKDLGRLYKKLKKNNRVLYVAPCGYGKTVVSAKIAYDATVMKGKNLLLVVPATTLIQKTVEEFSKYGIEAGVLAGGYSEDREKKCQIASRQYLDRNWDKILLWFVPDVFLFDECHETSFSQWGFQVFPKLKESGSPYRISDLEPALQVLGCDCSMGFEQIKERYKQAKDWAESLAYANSDRYEMQRQIRNAFKLIKEQKHLIDLSQTAHPQAKLIGFTATPFRLDKKENLGQIYQTQILAPTPGEMVKAGYLVPCVYFGADVAPDVENVSVSGGGDYNLDELSVACSHPRVVKAAIDSYMNICLDRIAMFFAVSIHHAKLLYESLRERNINAAYISSKGNEFFFAGNRKQSFSSEREERQYIIDATKAGDIRVLVSRDTCYRGVDIPPVSCVGLFRPTLSATVYIQIVGRGMRLSPETDKKDCYVLDQANLIKRFGHIEDVRYPRLGEGQPNYSQEVPIKSCPQCDAFLRLSDQFCPACGFIFEGGSRIVHLPDGQLEVQVPEKDKPVFDYYRYMLRVAYNKRKLPGWAAFKTREKFSFPSDKYFPDAWGRNAIFGRKITAEKIAVYKRQLEHLAGLKQKKENYVRRWLRVEFGEAKLREFGF